MGPSSEQILAEKNLRIEWIQVLQTTQKTIT